MTNAKIESHQTIAHIGQSRSPNFSGDVSSHAASSTVDHRSFQELLEDDNDDHEEALAVDIEVDPRQLNLWLVQSKWHIHYKKLVLDHPVDVVLKPTSLIRYRVSSGIQADLSTNLILKDKVWLGASYRTGDAFVASLEVLPTAQWRLGYAYDLGLSSISRYHNGSHELMLQYEFGYRIRVKHPRYF